MVTLTKTFIMKINELRLMIISNFILYYTSDDAEREAMLQCANDYVTENESEIDTDGLKSID